MMDNTGKTEYIVRDFEPMNLNDLAIFVSVADLGGFSAAARQLHIAKSTASERVRALEQELGTRLMSRTTRRMTLTEAGEALLVRGREMLCIAEEAEQAIAESVSSAVGTLRVAAPVAFGLRFLSDVVADLLTQHPRLSIDLALDEADVDLVRDRFDVAVRIGPLQDSSLVSHKLGETRHLTVASPAYIARHGRPEAPDDLRDHDCLRYTHQRTASWTFDGPEGPREVAVSGRLRCNHGDALAMAATRGLGIAWLPDFIALPYIHQERLELLLGQHCQSTAPIQAVFTARQYRTYKEQLFLDALERRLAIGA